MPRRKDTNEWKTDSRGRYRRMIGWKNENGKLVQQPFYFGYDLDQAKARHVRVKELWTHLEQTYQGYGPTEYDLPTEPVQYYWDGESLSVARELAAGRIQIVVPYPDRHNPSSYTANINRLAKKYPMVFFVPENPQAYHEGSLVWQSVAEKQLEKLPLPPANAGPQSHQNLHEALNAYVEHIRRTDLEPTPDGPRLTAFGNLKAEQAGRIKERLADRPLSTLEFQGCQDLVDYWRLRPMTQPRHGRAAKPMARKTCENHVAEMMRFFRWLHKSKDFAWRKPEDFDDLETKVKDITDERTSIEFLNVNVFSLDELAILNKYATPIERLLLLLGLNCGFKGAEQGTLRFEHLFLDRSHPHAAMLGEVASFSCQPEDKFILYSRNKSKVYGEFLLWEQTIAGLQWAVARQRSICARVKNDSTQLLLTDKGEPFFRRTGSNKNQSQIFMNKWAGLIRRIRKDYPDFPSHSFTSLRDTAADRIRHIAGGEVAAVFLCHGKAVKKDNLLDLYTNRPFGEVFKALRRLEQDLKPVFDAAPSDPWESPLRQYTSLGVREQMLELHRQGVKAPEIARRLGKSPMTVYRLIERYNACADEPSNRPD